MTFKTATDVAVWDASVFEWSVYHGEMLAGGVYLGADADVARTRAVAACKDFLTFWKDADPEPPPVIRTLVNAYGSPTVSVTVTVLVLLFCRRSTASRPNATMSIAIAT